ncbi:hypothetical protein INR49_015354, partial [Caranx melampygus]
MEMDTYVDKSEMSMDYDYVHDVEVRTDALENRPGEDSEVQAAARGVKLYRLVAVTFGLLCILQAAVNISLRLILLEFTEARYKNLSEERCGLERRLDTLASQLNSLTEERDELKRINSDTESRCKILRDEKEALERRMSTTGKFDDETTTEIRGVKLYRLVAVTFGLLCILQAAVNISLRFVH